MGSRGGFWVWDLQVDSAETPETRTQFAVPESVGKGWAPRTLDLQGEIAWGSRSLDPRAEAGVSPCVRRTGE